MLPSLKVVRGMAGLVTSACKSIDTIGFDVCDGNYDLSGLTGIIIPQAWERVIEPGWEITMSMRLSLGRFMLS
jgi:hypothetical protein